MKVGIVGVRVRSAPNLLVYVHNATPITKRPHHNDATALRAGEPLPCYEAEVSAPAVDAYPDTSVTACSPSTVR